MTVSDDHKLYQDSGRFWLERVKEVDAQTVEDVLALMDWPEHKADIRWAARISPSQVHALGHMKANVILAQLNLTRNVKR